MESQQEIKPEQEFSLPVVYLESLTRSGLLLINGVESNQEGAPIYKISVDPDFANKMILTTYNVASFQNLQNPSRQLLEQVVFGYIVSLYSGNKLERLRKNSEIDIENYSYILAKGLILALEETNKITHLFSWL